MADEGCTRDEGWRMDRRSFLRGFSVLVAALGLSVAAPLASFAQDKPKDDPKKQDKKGESKDESKSGDKGKKGGERDKAPDKVALTDEDGREYRICPQCGAHMYRQGRTWTCDECGYSYIE